MSTLPSGTVTFLFTDIVGSTPLWEKNPRAMHESLTIHNEILCGAVDSHGGHVFKVIGDAFQAAFVDPLHAVESAVNAQRALDSAIWGETGPIQVRMGLHAGSAEERQGDYVPCHTLNRVARIMSAAHGGQILISLAVAELVRGHLSPDVHLRDLGKHFFKGLSYPERIFQVSAHGLRKDFPELTSLGNPLSKLPLPLTRFIGRERELEALKGLIEKHRLVTLTGPGGSGKTHLSLVAARNLSPNFRDGVYFIPLESLSDAKFVPANVARALSLREHLDEDVLVTLKKHLQIKQSLLILDNFEHIMPAAPVFADLLEDCHKIRLLFTSREALRLAGEQLLPLPPMSLPDSNHVREVEKLTQFEAVQLFVERAQAIQPDFKITAENAESIAELCILLDGLPLAIELAAARVRMLSPEAMLDLMRQQSGTASLRLLTHGSREKQVRQQTLRATIDWSYQLLQESEKRFFRCLAVFAGGFSFRAVEQVYSSVNDTKGADRKLDVLDGIEMMVDKSLIRQDLESGGEPRYIMLKTIQEYALELLESHQESQAVLEKHALYFHSLAIDAERYLETDEQAVWFDRLEADHENLMAALRWAINLRNTRIGFEIAIPLVIFWFVRGYLSEGRAIMDSLLRIQDDSCHPLLRAKALDKASFLARYQKDNDHALTLIQESLEIHRQYRHQQGEADALANLGFILLWKGHYLESEKYYQESFKIYDKLGNQQGMADTLAHLSVGDYYQGNYGPSQEKIEKSLVIWENLGDRQGIAYALSNLGKILLRQGDLPGAQKTLTRSLALSKDIRFQLGIVASLEGLARLAMIVGKFKFALQLVGAARAMRNQYALPIPRSEQKEIDAALQPAYLSMDKDEAGIWLKEGQRINLDEFNPSVLSQLR